MMFGAFGIGLAFHAVAVWAWIVLVVAALAFAAFQMFLLYCLDLANQEGQGARRDAVEWMEEAAALKATSEEIVELSREIMTTQGMLAGDKPTMEMLVRVARGMGMDIDYVPLDDVRRLPEQSS
jgi:hypothetical protein